MPRARPHAAPAGMGPFAEATDRRGYIFIVDFPAGDRILMVAARSGMGYHLPGELVTLEYVGLPVSALPA